MAKVLVIGDTHCPAMHPQYVPFLKKIHKQYKCNKVVHIGDLVDWHAISFHETDPALPGAMDEYKIAKAQVRQLQKAFPRVEYLMGNHSDLPGRRGRTVGLPDITLTPFKDLWGLDGWNIHDRYSDIIIDGVIYRHGDKGKGGQRIAALANAEKEHRSLVQGHLHAQFGVEFSANHDRAIFGAQTGCGVLPGHPNMKYSRIYSARPILGCIVVINGEPKLERMKL